MMEVDLRLPLGPNAVCTVGHEAICGDVGHWMRKGPPSKKLGDYRENRQNNVGVRVGPTQVLLSTDPVLFRFGFSTDSDYSLVLV